MAALGSLQTFLSRAAQADEIIKILTTRLSALKQAKAAQWCAAEADKLRQENSALKAHVERLISDLSSLETQHGLVQVSPPNRQSQALPAKVSSSASAAPSPPAATKTCAAPPPPSAKEAKDKKGSAKKADPPAAVAQAKNTPSAEPPADCSRLLLKVGRVVSVARHPDADSLYVEEVDLAEGRLRTVVSGLVKHVPLNELQDRLGVFLCNLKPAKMRGVSSEAMIMCASTPEKVCVIDPPKGAVPGDKIVFEKYPGEPDDQLNPKKKTWEQIQPDLRTDENGVATYKGDPFLVAGKGMCTAAGCANFPIK